MFLRRHLREDRAKGNLREDLPTLARLVSPYQRHFVSETWKYLLLTAIYSAAERSFCGNAAMTEFLSWKSPDERFLWTVEWLAIVRLYASAGAFISKDPSKVRGRNQPRSRLAAA